MTLRAEYQTDNIFARILRGELPAIRVYEDSETLAFMDVFPQSEGHTLVIPRDVQACNLLDIPAERLGSLFRSVQRVARAVQHALSPDGIRIVQFNGAEAGQTVFHLHVHIIPVYAGVATARHGTGRMLSADELEPVAARIRAAIQP